MDSMNRSFLASMVLVLMFASSVSALDVPRNLRAVVDKRQSLGLSQYPIGFWSSDVPFARYSERMNKGAVEDWANEGFSIVMSPKYDAKDPRQVAHISKMLDWCKDRNIKMILCDPRCYAKADVEGKHVASNYADQVRAAVKDFGGHPALFGFHVGDEPNSAFLPVFRECYQVQNDISPTLHPFGNLLPLMQVPLDGVTPEKYLDEYVSKTGADLLSYDCYTQMLTRERGDNKQFGEGGIDNYFENLRVFRDGSLRNGVPFWTTVLSVGHLCYRCPNLDDIRWQFNTAVCCGASGILYWFYYMVEPNANYRQAPVDELWQNTSGHYNLGLVHNSFRKVYGDLFTRIVSTKVMFYGKVYGHGRPFAPDALISDISTDLPNHPVLIGEFADIEGKRYVMIVNNSQTTDAQITVTFPGKDVKVCSWNWDHSECPGHSFATTGGGLTEAGYAVQHWLAPGQEAVYRVESSLIDSQPVPVE